MKKVLLAFDSTNFSEGAFNFAKQINEREPILLTGAFLPQIDVSSLWSYASAAAGPLMIPLVEDDVAIEIQTNIARFESLCKENKIEYRIHKDLYNFALPELQKESRYADIMLIGSESFYNHFTGMSSNDYISDVLHNSECPVIVLPESFSFPANNILSFDGSEDSVHAIKQFAYIFPWLCQNPSLLVYASNKDNSIPSVELIEEFARTHFPELTISKLDINPYKYFSSWVMEKKNSILISGAYGRSAASQLFKRSFVSDVINEHNLPVFVAHK